MVQNWANRTPDNFKFTAKFPKVITHEKKFRNVENELSQFYEAMIPLKSDNNNSNTSLVTIDERLKIQALQLVNECYKNKIDLVTNGVIVKDASRFVQSHNTNTLTKRSSESSNSKTNEVNNESIDTF